MHLLTYINFGLVHLLYKFIVAFFNHVCVCLVFLYYHLVNFIEHSIFKFVFDFIDFVE